MAATFDFSEAMRAAPAVLPTSINLASGKCCPQPLATLGNRLWLAVDFAHFRTATSTKQIMMDGKQYLRADLERLLGEHGQRIDNATIG